MRVKNKIKKIFLTVILVGLFCGITGDFVLAKTTEEFTARFKELAQEEHQNKKVKIECEKNPELCPIFLESLTVESLVIGEKGNIKGAEDSNLHSEKTSLFENFTQKLKQALSSLGIVIENGIVKVKELIAEKITSKEAEIDKVRMKRIEMIDQQTGEIYCTWIENGEWIKIKSACEEISNLNDRNLNEENQICDSEHLDLCNSRKLCEEIGLYWYGRICNLKQEELNCVSEQEVCDNIDNDCDGEIDESVDCGATSCDPGDALNLIGENCQNICVKGSCQICVPVCVCTEGFSDCNGGDGTGSDADGCETRGGCSSADDESPAEE